MAGFPGFPFVNPIGQLCMFKEFKDQAKQALNHNRLAEAHQWYNEALRFCQQPFPPQQIANEHHVILCNRSQVCYRQGLYPKSEDDALTAISICPSYVKAYWRASQAVLAGPRSRRDLAVKYLADALWLVFQADGNEQDQRHFLTEICKLATDTNITGSKQTTLRNLPLPDARHKIWSSVLKKLYDQNEWESIAMLLIHYDSRNIRYSLNTLDVSDWKCEVINVGKLLSSLPDKKMELYGEQLAIFLLQKGASVDTIEAYTKTNPSHFVVKLAMRIHSVLLLRFILENYESIRANINYQDDEGNTALHLAVKASIGNVDVCEIVFDLLLKNKCDMTLRDCANKTPVDYISKDSKLFKLLQKASNPVEGLRKKLEQLKAEGNKAFASKDYTKAVCSYDEALVIAQQSPDLYKEAAILYSNKSNVRYQMGDTENALINALDAINSDPEYSKGYYWHSKALFRLGSAIDAFKTVVQGCSKTEHRDSKVTLLTEAAVILRNLEGDKLMHCYQMFVDQNTNIWQSVLTQLSKKSEWKSIAYLILGPNLEVFTPVRLHSGGVHSGVARGCSTAAMETRTIFKYLQGLDEIPPWLDIIMSLVHAAGGEKVFRNFAVDENDCPLHAVLRFVLKTGSVSLLETFPHKGSGWCDKIGTEESGFHILAKNKLSADFLLKVARILLMKGYNDTLRKDKEGKIPYDYLHDEYPFLVYDLFLPDNKALESVHVRRLCRIGQQKNDKGEHEDAIRVFSKILHLKIKRDYIMGHQDSYNFALKNRAISYLKIGEPQKALTDANKSLKLAQTYDVYLIRAKASLYMISYEHAFKDFIQAFDYTRAGLSEQRFEVSEEIVKFLFQLPSQQSISMMHKISTTLPRNEPVWARICHKLVLQNEWKAGKIAYLLFKNGRAQVLPMQLSLKCFCCLKDIRGHQWSADMLLYFLHCGSDKRTLSIEKGDTYLHAAVRISLVANFPELLDYLIRISDNNEQHLLDQEGNTLLHIATKEKKVDKNLRYDVIRILMKCSVDTRIQNKYNRTASSYLSGEEKNKNLLENIPRQTKGYRSNKVNVGENRSRANETNVMQRTRNERRHKCVECEERHSKAVEIISADKANGVKAMTEILILNHTNKFHASIEKKVVEDLVKYIDNQEDITTCLSQLRKEKYILIIEGLFSIQKWSPLFLAINAFNKKFGDKELKRFTSKFTIEHMVVDSSSVSDDEEYENICFLLNNGWKIGDGNGKVTLKKAIGFKKLKLSVELIKRGADVSELTLEEGDTPIHALIKIALQVKEFKFIEDMLDKWSFDKEKYSYLDPEQVDANGDCIYHLLAKSGYTDLVLQITELLCGKNVSAAFHNKEHKYPSEYVKKKHFRLIDYLKNASRIKASRKQILYTSVEKQNHDMSTTAEHKIDKEIKPKPKSRKEQIQESRSNIELLISSFPDFLVLNDSVTQNNAEEKSEENIVYDKSTEFKKQTDDTLKILKEQKIESFFVSSGEGNEENENVNDNNNENNNSMFDLVSDKVHEAKGLLQKHNDMMGINQMAVRTQVLEDFENDRFAELPDGKQSDTSVDSEDSEIEGDDMSEPLPLEADDDGTTSAHQTKRQNLFVCGDPEYDINEQNTFENLPWEVECTDKVLKALEDKQVIPKLKLKIVQIIKMLASGDWQRHLCKELKNIPKSLNLNLFEAKLSKGRRIIWENAISFSSRCSDTADNRLNSKKAEAPAVRGGRIYSQVIRVWDIVMDHDKIERSVENIKRSHLRGDTCIIKKKLKGLKTENEQRLRISDKTYPLLFTENDADLSQSIQDPVQHVPPASSNETEYHILKFYPVDTPLVKHFLLNSDVKVDFPFKVTDLEHAVINLIGKEAILLLGRSGTGKTTCCLYRLWSQYRTYWINRRMEDPLLPGSTQIQCHEKDACIDKKTGACGDCCSDEKEQSESTNNENNTACSSAAFEHFHQLFITKNQVLAAEVKKTFREFKNADVSFTEMHSDGLDQQLPNRLQDLQENDFPLFLTSRQMLCKLDASIGDPFFKREGDGSMKIHVDGWDRTDDVLTGLHILEYDSDDEEEIDEADIDVNETYKRKKENDIRREVTYEVFENEMWRKLESKTKTGYHPSLIWTEIMSFIKGSYESLSSKNGFLSKEEYLELGRKRAPTFSGHRDAIYDIFLLYEHYKRNHQMFDETDVVHDIFRRIAKLETTPITLHQIYVDETQDFTQAELFLLIRLCKNPNDMFLTGDTAQSIMRGIAFRFEDLKTLFFHIRQNAKANKSSNGSKSLEVNVPQLHQLTYNYRSHAGILNLASSILEVLVEFFPESFDRLEPDKGLFPGPEPILIESCTFSDLAVLLSGNRRETSNIEFGAHQVILVYNEEARENLPDELSCGLVLTIYESKGLEFDDVLLFNFFKYSQASKEWRVVTKHLNDLAEKFESRTSQTGHCVRIDNDLLMSGDRPRPLEFDPNQHKILCSELKQLYTALTRARVNVWIYDEDADKRGPMFEYFKALNLVKPVDITELNDESLSKVFFAENSSKQDWIKQGDYFMKNRRYNVAAQCFGKGGDRRKQMLAQAHDRALLAQNVSRGKSKLKGKNEMRDEFLFAAELYLNCHRYPEAAICLNNAKEVKSAIALYTKLRQFEKAAEICKKNGLIVECSRLYESADQFNKAVSILCENGVYDIALDVLKRYRMRETEMVKNNSEALAILRANRPDKIYTEEKISQRAAEKYHVQKDFKRMQEAVSRFHDEDDKIEFYKKHHYINEAAKLMANTGKFSEAVNIYIKHGYLDEARDFAYKSRDDAILAKSLFDISRITVANENDAHDLDTVRDDLTKSFEIFERCGEAKMAGDVLLLHAKVNGDTKFIMSAGKKFLDTRSYTNEAGYLECCILLEQLANKEDQDTLDFLLKGVDCLFKVCFIFLRKYLSTNKENLADQQKFVTYCQFYGMFPKGDVNFEIFPKTKPLCEKILSHYVTSSMHEVVTLDAEKCSHMIVQHLLTESKPWLERIKDTLILQRSSLLLCNSFELGEKCADSTTDSLTCMKMHKPYTKDEYKRLIKIDVQLAEYEVSLNKTDDLLKLCYSKHSKNIKLELTKLASDVYRIKGNENYMACKFLLNDCLFKSGHPVILAEDSAYMLKPVISNKVALEHIKQYLIHRWSESTKGDIKLKSKAAYETEVFLLLEFAFHIFHFDSGRVKFSKNPKELMLFFEKALDKELMDERNLKKVEQNEKLFTLMLGAVKMPQSNRIERRFLTCVAHRFTDAYEHLVKGNPFDAIMAFAKFQTQLSQRRLKEDSIVNFYPDIHHYLFWLEFFCTISFLVIAKLKSKIDQQHSTIIPTQYLALLYFVESTFPREALRLIHSISRWTTKSTQRAIELMLDRVKRFGFVVSGHAQCVKIPELIGNACEEDKSNFVLLERLLVLNMTMLSNIGRSVPVECKSSLVNSLKKALTFPNRSERMRNIRDPAKQLESVTDVIDCFEKFLECRKMDESVVEIKWTPETKEKIRIKPLDTTNLPSVLINQNLDEPVVDPQKSLDDLAFDLEQTEDEIHADIQEKEEFNKSLGQEMERTCTKSVDFDLTHDETSFDHVVTDDNGCFMCGIVFENIKTEKDLSECDYSLSTSQSKESSSKIDTILRQDSANENTTDKLDFIKLSHTNSQEHRQNVERLQDFQSRYKSKIMKIVTEAEILLKDCNSGEQLTETYKVEIKAIEKSHERIKFALAEIERFAHEWQQKQDLVNKLADKLQSDIESLMSYKEKHIKEIETFQSGQGAVGLETGDALDDDEGDNIEDVVQEPVKTKRQRKNARRKSRKN